jgi:hypothetical protein
MPFNAEQISYGGKLAIDFFQKNTPIDQINTDRPLLKKMIEGKQGYPGGKQYVVEQLRKSNSSNFQSYFGSSQVTYNRKRTIDQAKFAYGSFHDGFGLDEDELVQNGIVVTDEKNAEPSASERVALTNLFTENMQTLKDGFEENFDIMLHRDGSVSETDIAGLDHLVQLDPTASSDVGTINQSSNSWWQNVADLDITEADLIDRMEIDWRETTRYGGTKPNFILCGGDFLDSYRRAAGLTVNRQITGAKGLEKGGVSVDASTSAVYFKGVELVWDPVFDVLDELDAPAIAWSKRCYFLNTQFLKLRPINGHWMISRRPPRVYDRYVHYFALTSKAAMTVSKRRAQAVLSVY